MTDCKAMLISMAKTMGIKVTNPQAEQFQTYLELLLSWNEKINLTAITDRPEVVEKHFMDSLTLLSHCKIKPGAKLIDVGTGAGFPGIPLKILRPDIELTLLDGLNKRLNFLGEVCSALHITAERIHKRAEEAGRDHKMRESYDIVTARAVAPLNILCEYCLPLTKMKGFFLAMKGPGAQEELAQAERALNILGGTDRKIISLSLPTAGERNIIAVQKKAFTPREYPRHGGTITKHPLI